VVLNLPETLSQFYWWLLLGALSLIGIAFSFIWYLIQKNITAILSKINDNQDALAKILGEKINNIEIRQDKLEEAHEETKTKVDNLLGQHEVVMKMGGHQ
jgi:hypothetical protein